MAEVLGPQTLLDLALPTGWDATRITQWAMRDGITYGELVNGMAIALGSFNQEMIDRWGWCMSLTEEIAMEYPNGGSVTKMPEISEYARPEPTKGTTIGHMLDLRDYGDSVGGSRHYWRDARSVKVRAGITNIVKRGQWRFEYELLNRWFTNTENAVGSSGYSVPFVRGTGGSVDFAPPAYDGEAFTTSHNHYMGIDDDTYDWGDVISQMADNLQEHGHELPFRMLVSRSDIANYSALTNFVKPVEPIVWGVDQGAGTSNRFIAKGVARPFGFLGFYESDYGPIEIFYSARIPTLYAGMMKSYGSLDMRNGLAVRVHPNIGFGAYVIPVTAQESQYPISQLDVEFTFGVGVGEDRTNGVAAYLVSGGTWANPTIS